MAKQFEYEKMKVNTPDGIKINTKYLQGIDPPYKRISQYYNYEIHPC